LIVIIWLGTGVALFLGLFARRARMRDATDAARNPELLTLRGRSPLVLVPIANPQNAEALLTLANALVPVGIGRVLMQNVVVSEPAWDERRKDQAMDASQTVWRTLLGISGQLGVRAEALTTVADEPMAEIVRVAELHRCRWLVMGLSELAADGGRSRAEQLLDKVDADVIVLRAGNGWKWSEARRILVPTAGRGGHDYLLGRLVGSLQRDHPLEITCMRVVPPAASETDMRRARQSLRQLAADLVWQHANTEIDCDEDRAACISRRAADHDLIIVGTRRRRGHGKVIGPITRQIAAATTCPLVVISRRN
jgi:nucleotide-binding universal stress UspA family protein